MHSKKSGTGFANRIREDERFCAFVAGLSPDELYRFLSCWDWKSDDWDAAIRGLQVSCLQYRDPERMKEFTASIHRGFRGMVLDETKLTGWLDDEKSLLAIKLYNMGVKQRIVIPIEERRELAIEIWRGDGPKIPEDTTSARERLAALLVDAAYKQEPSIRVTL